MKKLTVILLFIISLSSFAEKIDYINLSHMTDIDFKAAKYRIDLVINEIEKNGLEVEVSKITLRSKGRSLTVLEGNGPLLSSSSKSSKVEAILMDYSNKVDGWGYVYKGHNRVSIEKFNSGYDNFQTVLKDKKIRNLLSILSITTIKITPTRMAGGSFVIDEDNIMHFSSYLTKTQLELSIRKHAKK